MKEFSDICDYLVVGTGSISKRHISNLRALYPKSKIGNVSASGKLPRRMNKNVDFSYNSIEESTSKTKKFAIIASPASFHLDHAEHFLKKNIPTLIEKPITSDLEKLNIFIKAFKDKQNIIDVGYNFRFNKALRLFKKTIFEKKKLGKISSININVGQHLSLWRKNKNYKHTVSANDNLGGGVLRELSHELDYITWVFGKFDKVFCKTSNRNILKVNVEESIDAIFMNKSGFNLNLHMDFLNSKATRYCRVIGEKGTLILDLVNNSISFIKPGEKAKILYKEKNLNQNDMYIKLLKNFKEVSLKKAKPKVSLEDSVYITNLIEIMKTSSKNNTLCQI